MLFMRGLNCFIRFFLWTKLQRLLYLNNTAPIWSGSIGYLILAAWKQVPSPINPRCARMSLWFWVDPLHGFLNYSNIPVFSTKRYNLTDRCRFLCQNPRFPASMCHANRKASDISILYRGTIVPCLIPVAPNSTPAGRSKSKTESRNDPNFFMMLCSGRCSYTTK